MIFLIQERGITNLLKEKIASEIKGFSPSQARIARFILDHPREAPFMTASQMAERIDVSESSVIRFASHLGYSGYPELKEAMKELLLDQMTTIERMALYDDDHHKESTCQRTMALDMLDLGEAQKGLDPAKVELFAKALVQAPSVYFAAQRSSSVLAQYLGFYLSWFLPSVNHLTADLFREKLITAPSESLVVGISFPRYSRWTVDVVSMAKERGHRIGVISDSSDSPMAQSNPEHTLVVPCRHISFIDSFTAPMSLMNCIIMAVAEELGEKAKGRLVELEELWTEGSVYSSK